MSRTIVLGASGMLGSALVPECVKRGHEVIVERVEVTDSAALIQHIHQHDPDIVINCAAKCNLADCELDPEAAFSVNALPAFVIATNFPEIRFVQISSDQARTPLNEYAHTKEAAERYAARHPNALIVRTNIVGLKNMDWAFRAIEQDDPVTLFYDYYTSSIDVWSFSEALMDVLEQHPDERGLLNIASRDTESKKEFVETLSARIGKPLTQAKIGSVKGLWPERPCYSGLDVSCVESLLGRRMPGLGDVIDQLAERKLQTAASSTPYDA